MLLYLAPNGVPPMWMACSFPIALGGIIMHVYYATISNIRDAACIVQRPLEIRHSRLPSIPLITLELDIFITVWYINLMSLWQNLMIQYKSLVKALVSG